MKTFLSIFVALSVAALAKCAIIERVVCDSSIDGDIYGFSATPVNGSVADRISFDVYQGSVVLVTNVASYNTRSTSGFLELNDLMSQYASQPFTVLGFPSTQFNREVPESNDELMNALFYVRPGNGFVPTFPVFQKTLVNGNDEDAFFTFIKTGCSYTEEEFNVDLEYSPMKVSDFRQPFEKILVGKDGKPYFRYHASVDVSVVIADIDALLAA